MHSPISNKVAAPRRECRPCTLILFPLSHRANGAMRELMSDWFWGFVNVEAVEEEDDEAMLRQLQAEMAS